LATDPGFVDAEVAAASCLFTLVFLDRQDAVKAKQYLARAVPLLQTAKQAEPANPRMLWVLGAGQWYLPPERGGGQDTAIATYHSGLTAARAQKRRDALEPSWGEPELLMNLGWSNLHRTTPDLAAAERYARAALALVPSWHYVRDILLPQIRAAEAKPL
jgi:hypothetical protein